MTLQGKQALVAGATSGSAARSRSSSRVQAPT
jgi:hypothetical protein